jgi:hypothetical protein
MWRMWRMIWSSADASCSEDYGITPKASSILHIFHGARIALFFIINLIIVRHHCYTNKHQ